MTFLDAALEVLRRAGGALHVREIAAHAAKHGLLTHVGRAPEETMRARLDAEAARPVEAARVLRVRAEVYAIPGTEDRPGKLAAPPPARIEEPAAPEPSARAEAASAREAGREPARRDRPAEAARRGDADGKRTRRRRGKGGRGGAVGKSTVEVAAPAEAAARPERIASSPGDASSASADEGGRRRRRRGGRGRGRGRDEAPKAEVLPVSAAPAVAERDSRASSVREAGREVEPHDAGGVGDARAPDEAPRATPSGEHERAEPAPAPERRERPAPPHARYERHERPERAGRPASAGLPSLADAAQEILGSQSGGRAIHYRQLADMAVKRRLVALDVPDVWRAMRAALRADDRERLAQGLRPRFRAVGAGQVALVPHRLEAELNAAEERLAVALAQAREATVRAVATRLRDLPLAPIEIVARLLLRRMGFGEPQLVKRTGNDAVLRAAAETRSVLCAVRAGVCDQALVAALADAPRGGAATRLAVMASGVSPADVRDLAALRGVDLRDGVAMAALLVEQGVGVVRTTLPVSYLDEEFFNDLAEPGV
ncbi:MAG: HTH domain-containing protein [Myxococcota bacterium]